jgi:prepilin-type N-terminal cleavage/methylation domain-containing protein
MGAARRKTFPGMTLTELMVAIFIVLIAMQGFTTLFLRSWKTNGFILETGLAASAASRAVSTTVSELRKIRQGDNGDYPIEAGDDFEFVAYIDIDGDGVTERVRYFLENGQFKRGVREPSATQPVTYANGYGTVTVLASDIANEPTEPVFSYYNDDYPGDTVNNPLGTPIAIRDARLAKVRLVINIDPNNAPDDTNIESFVEFRNLNNYVQ